MVNPKLILPGLSLIRTLVDSIIIPGIKDMMVRRVNGHCLKLVLKSLRAVDGMAGYP